MKTWFLSVCVNGKLIILITLRLSESPWGHFQYFFSFIFPKASQIFFFVLIAQDRNLCVALWSATIQFVVDYFLLHHRALKPRLLHKIYQRNVCPLIDKIQVEMFGSEAKVNGFYVWCALWSPPIFCIIFG